MQTIFNLRRATLTTEKEKTWVSALAEIEENINSTIHAVTGYVLAVLHFGIHPRLKATKSFLDSVTVNNFIDPEEVVPNAQRKMTVARNRNAEQFNLARYKAFLFAVGDLVAVEDSRLAGGGKSKPKFSGPYKVNALLP